MRAVIYLKAKHMTTVYAESKQAIENIVSEAKDVDRPHEHVFEQFPTLQLSVCIRCGCKCPMGCEDEYIND